MQHTLLAGLVALALASGLVLGCADVGSTFADAEVAAAPDAGPVGGQDTPPATVDTPRASPDNPPRIVEDTAPPGGSGPAGHRRPAGR